MSSGDLSKIAWLALVVVVSAAVVLGLIIGYDLRPASTAFSRTPKTADITLVVQGDVKLGPDGKLHDAFTPCNFTVYAGQEVDLTIVNYDNGEHTFTSPSLGVNFTVPPSNVTGVPTVSNFQFNETTVGVYRWYCTYPCDTDAGGWAMTTGSDGQPDQIGYMGGFVTVLAG
ncbi:MAG TPA: cupredoxin domain-containing protein [Candidatus Limnocylindrales bacterium]|nr:cupredoxin domain-containing protein [Candidatus Limnocylindrales bacterium]